MDLTPENRASIDARSYAQLLTRWRLAPVGDPWFAGETGEYWSRRMAELRAQGADHARIPKAIGWGRQ